MNKNIILAGAVAIGIYFLSQAKKIPFIAGAQRSPSATTSMVRQRTAQKIAQKVAQKIAQKVAPKRIGQPITQAARIAALRKAAARKAAAERGWLYWHKKMKARKAAAQKAAVRKAAAQKIGKKIGKTVAQKVGKKISGKEAFENMITAISQRTGKTKTEVKEELGRARERLRAKQRKAAVRKATAKLFSGAEKSKIIPYSEGSKHSYYGPKSRKVWNEGYMEKRYKADRKQAQDARIEELRAMFPQSKL